MTAAPRRWIRLDLGWERSDWIADLPPGAKLAWVLLLGYTKAYGVCGAVKALTTVGAAREFGVAEADFRLMADAAMRDGALSFEAGTWIVTGWDRYQNEGAAERQRRHRKDRSRLSPLRDVTDSNVTSRHVTDLRELRENSGETLTLTLTETELQTPSVSPPKKKRPWKFCPADWQPSEKHRELAATLGVPLDREVTAFREWEFKDPKTDPDRAFFRWLRTAAERPHANGNGKPSPKPPTYRRLLPDP